MSFKEFDITKIEEARKTYAEEAKERWGGTDSYKESQEKTEHYNKEDWKKISREADQIFAGFAECVRRHLPSESHQAQQQVAAWQQHITCYYYACTDEILAGLGLMYTADERFRQNMDQAGEGTAQYMSDAIRDYVEMRKS